MSDSKSGEAQRIGNSGTTLALACSLLLALMPASAFAQGYPVKPVRIILPLSVGGPNDFVARILAQHFTAALGQQFVVENRPGVGGTIGAAAVAKAPADGHTLLFASTTTLSISPSLYPNPGYDALTSFSPISTIATAPFLVVVHPALPARTLKELISLAKSRPGQLNFGSGGSGTPVHIGGEMLKAAAGVDIVHVTYKGVSAAVIDLVSGRIQLLVEQLYPIAPHIQSGKIRALAVASSKRHPQLPHLPTAAEAGLPGYEVTAWSGLVAPRGTPAEVVRQLNQELVKTLRMKEVRESFYNQGVLAAGSSPEEFSAFIASEFAKWSRAVKASGAKAE